MNITNKDDDQYILLAVASGLAYLSWVAFNPTLGYCTSSEYWGLATVRVVVYFTWLFYICFRHAPYSKWKWSYFIIGSTTGGWIFALGVIIFFAFSEPFSGENIRTLLQPIVYIAPTAIISGLYSAFSISSLWAAASGIGILTAQLLIDGIIFSINSCV